MKQVVCALLVCSGLFPTSAVLAQTDSQKASAPGESQPVPKELERFSGMIIGKLVSKDLERGEFTVTVDYVARVWENNKASQPRSAVGKTLTVEGVTGKFLDALLLIKPGDTMEFEAQHQSGDRLKFPGEWLRKAAPFDAARYPIPPDAFRGFQGVLSGKIEAKEEESGELVVRVEKIERTGEKNQAENVQSVIGKPIMLGGFWGPRRKPFEPMKVGDSIRAVVLHRVKQSDLFSVTELLE